MKTAKSILQKALDTSVDPELALLDFRDTPTERMGTSPAQRLHSRRTRTLIPLNDQLVRPEVVSNVQEKLHRTKIRQSHYYDRNSKELKPLQVGNVVRVRPIIGEKWFKVKVEHKVNVWSYEVRLENGAVYRRNRRHLRKVQEPFTPQNEDTAAEPPANCDEEQDINH